MLQKIFFFNYTKILKVDFTPFTDYFLPIIFLFYLDVTYSFFLCQNDN